MTHPDALVKWCSLGRVRVGAMRRRAFGLRPVPTSLSRPFGFNPSRLRAFAPTALRASLASRGKPCGLSPPHDAWLLSTRPASHRNGQGADEHAGTCCGRLCRSVPSSTLAVLAHHVTKDSSRTTRPASLWSFHDTRQDRHREVRQKRFHLSSGG